MILFYQLITVYFLSVNWLFFFLSFFILSAGNRVYCFVSQLILFSSFFLCPHTSIKLLWDGHLLSVQRDPEDPEVSMYSVLRWILLLQYPRYLCLHEQHVCHSWITSLAHVYRISTHLVLSWQYFLFELIVGQELGFLELTSIMLPTLLALSYLLILQRCGYGQTEICCHYRLWPRSYASPNSM